MDSSPSIEERRHADQSSPLTQTETPAATTNRTSNAGCLHTTSNCNNIKCAEQDDEGSQAEDLLALLSQREEDDAVVAATNEINEAGEDEENDLLDELLMLVDDDNNVDYASIVDLSDLSPSSTAISSQQDLSRASFVSGTSADSVGVRRTLLSFGKSDNGADSRTEAARATASEDTNSVPALHQPQRISGFGFASGSGSIPQYRSSGGLSTVGTPASSSTQQEQHHQQPARLKNPTAPASTSALAAQRVSGGGFQAIGLGNSLSIDGGDDGDDGGPNSSSSPLPFEGKPFILCPRSRIRFVPTHQRSVQNFLANEFEAVTARQLPYKEIVSVNREHSSPSSSSAFSVVGVVVSKYYPRGTAGGGGLYSVAGNGVTTHHGDSDDTANGSSGAGGATYGIVKLWDLRGTSLHTGANSSNPNILTLLVGGAAFVANFSRLVPGTVIIVLGPTLSKSKGGRGGGGGGSSVGTSSAQMPMFRVNEMSSLLIAGRAMDCVPCAATTNGANNSSGGRGGGPFGGGSLSFKKSGGAGGMSGMGVRQCTVLVNKAVSEFCTFHAAGAASRLMRQAMASSTQSHQSQSHNQTPLTTVTTHTTGVTTARLRSLSTPFALTASSSGGGIGGVGGFSANAAALKVAGSVGATAALNPLLALGGGGSTVTSNPGPARNVMLRPPSSAAPTSTLVGSSSVVGELKTLLSSNSDEKSGVRTATRALAAEHKQTATMSLKQSLQAQLSGILGIGVTATTEASFAPPSQRSVEERPKAVPSSSVLGTANATFNLLNSVGDDDFRSGETSPRGRWRALGLTSPAAPQPQPRPAGDSVLSKAEDFICTKGGKIVNQQTQRLAGVGSGEDGGMSSATRELLRHRMEPKEAMSGRIGMKAVLLPHTTRAPPAPSSSSSVTSAAMSAVVNDHTHSSKHQSSIDDVTCVTSRLPLAQHSRIPSHFTGLGSGGGINVSTPAATCTAAAATSAVAATAALGGPRGRMMLAAAVDAQTKERMKQQLDEAKRMTIVVKEATKRTREGEGGEGEKASAVGEADGEASKGGPRFEPDGRAQLLSEYKFGGDSPVPSTFFVRRGASATSTAQGALRQQILAGNTTSQQQQLQQAAALGLPAGVRVLNPNQAPSSSSVSAMPSHGSRAFAPLSGSGGSATFVGGGGVGGAARSAQLSLVQTAGESAFVASALAVASSKNSSDDAKRTAAGHSANASLLVSLAKKTASRHSEALSAEEWDAKLTTVDKIVRAEKALEALDRIFEVPDVPCAYCEECERYFANSVTLDSCRRAGHTVRRTTAIRRFYECAECNKYRIQVLEPSSDAASGSSAGAGSVHTSIVQGSAAVFNTNTQKHTERNEGRRRVLDRDCGVCKRLGTWRRCSAAPVAKGDSSSFER